MIVLLFAWIGVVSSASMKLNRHPADNMISIWNDKGSGANKNVSIWKSVARPGYYRVGDVAVTGYHKPKGFLVRLTDQDDFDKILQLPVSYCTVWNDSHLPTNTKVQIWRVVCPITMLH